MKVDNISNNVSFRKVFAVAGYKPQLNEFCYKVMKENQGHLLIMPATDMYLQRQEEGQASRAIKNGKRILFFITGKKDTEKASSQEKGWSSLNEISQHVSKFITVNNIDKDSKSVISNTKK